MSLQQRLTLQNAAEWLDAIVVSVLAVLLVFTFAVKTYVVDGTSMEPTLADGTRVFAWSLFYEPHAGDIVAIDATNSYGEPLIKRVAATAGQVVDIDEFTGAVTVDGVPFDYLPEGDQNLRGDINYPYTVPDDCIFVLGDNRAVSLDSRYSEVGPINEKSVLGKQFFALAW